MQFGQFELAEFYDSYFKSLNYKITERQLNLIQSHEWWMDFNWTERDDDLRVIRVSFDCYQWDLIVY